MGAVLAAIRRYRVLISGLGLRHIWTITDQNGNSLALSDIYIRGVSAYRGDIKITLTQLGLKRAFIDS